MSTVRIILAGPVAAVSPTGQVIVESDFPSRQARRAFAYLVLMRTAGATSEQLAEAVWPADPPPGWRSGVSALVSRLRQLFATRMDGALTIDSEFGLYRLHASEGPWVDVDASLLAVEQGRGALSRADAAGARAHLMTACVISARPFLAGEEGSWIDEVRRQLLETRIRALEGLAQLELDLNAPEEAVRWLEELLRLDPYRDRTQVALMRALSLAGNPSRAVAVYLNTQRLLADELGVDPSPEAQAAYLEILRATERADPRSAEAST